MAEQDENLEPDPDELARRARIQEAAGQGIDQLAGVLDEQISNLAEEFETRTERVVSALLDNAGGAQPADRKFVSGALFGAGLFLLSLIGSLVVTSRPRRQ